MTVAEGIRTAGQVRQQLKQVLFRHLQKVLRANFAQVPESCAHNTRVSVGDTGVFVGACGYSQKGRSCRGRLCDSRIPESAQMARTCPWWAPLRTKEEVKSAFRELISSGDRGKIASKYPDVAALMWVLEGGMPPGMLTEVEAVLDDQEGGDAERPVAEH